MKEPANASSCIAMLVQGQFEPLRQLLAVTQLGERLLKAGYKNHVSPETAVL